MGRLHSLQTLRFFAALAVVLDHAALEILARIDLLEWRGVPKDIGALGVHVFFVISGFIMVHAVLARPVGAGRFLFDRWWRIAPIYLLATVTCALLTPETATWDQIATTLTFWPVWSTQAVSHPVMHVGWTLCFEMLFYTCLALTRLNRLFAPALLIGFIACWIASNVSGAAIFRFLGNPIILEFLAGVALALLWKGERRPRLGACLIVGAAVWMSVVLVLGRPDMGGGIGSPLPRVVVFIPPAAALVYGSLQFKGEVRVLPYLGDTSYALYLFHTIVLLALSMMPDAMWPALAPLAVIFSIAVSVSVHEYIEKPLAKMKRKLSMGPALVRA